MVKSFGILTPGGNASSGTQARVGTPTMMSQILDSLSPQARAEFEALYPQMLQLMDNSHMMSGTATAGSMMGVTTTGIGHSPGSQASAA